jgi:hypothetical protein
MERAKVWYEQLQGGRRKIVKLKGFARRVDLQEVGVDLETYKDGTYMVACVNPGNQFNDKVLYTENRDVWNQEGKYKVAVGDVLSKGDFDRMIRMMKKAGERLHELVHKPVCVEIWEEEEMKNELEVKQAVKKILADEKSYPTSLNYAVNYCRAALSMQEEELRVQCLYILNNIQKWRHTDAKEVRAALKRFAGVR